MAIEYTGDQLRQLLLEYTTQERTQQELYEYAETLGRGSRVQLDLLLNGRAIKGIVKAQVDGEGRPIKPLVSYVKA